MGGNGNIKDGFNSAGLPLRIATSTREFSRRIVNDTDAFLFDIRNCKTGKNENRQTFVVHVGKGNEISVVSSDLRRKQVIMKVTETERKLVTERWEIDRKTNKYKRIQETTTTSGEERWFLAGEDERHLFVAQLPSGATNVTEAHRLLRPQSLKNAKTGKDFRRQGEWFFTDVDNKMDARLTEYLEMHKANNLSKLKESQNQISFKYSAESAVGRSGGRPHIASHVISIGTETFVLGSVSHPDHKTVHFSSWVRVTRNTEVINTKLKGVQWVD